MKQVADIKHIYFIGIGGIGMSALARYFHEKGVRVHGYDKTRTHLTETLEKEGIAISYNDEADQVMESVDTVVYTPAIPADSGILNSYKAAGLEILKRADLLQIVTASMRTIAVAGTHGKTTTSTMIAYLFRECGYGCQAFLGGIAVNYNSNYWSDPNSNIAVVEADEYDRSFLKLSPETAVLTSMDADHLDIYGDKKSIQQSFIDFTHRLTGDLSTLVVKERLPRMSEMGGVEKITYSLQNDLAQSHAANIRISKGGYYFDVVNPEWIVQNIYLPVGGMHNVENCVAAITVAKKYFFNDQEIIDALAGFKGIKRRFEYVVKSDDLVYIDDYAHHPEELSALLKSAKTLFPKKKLSLIFQPHLYTRTRDFAAEFAQVLSIADEVILLDIYPAREQPIEGVSSSMIADMIGNPNVTILSKEGAIDYAANANVELLITAGAGDIDNIVLPIKEKLTK